MFIHTHITSQNYERDNEHIYVSKSQIIQLLHMCNIHLIITIDSVSPPPLRPA